jgi:molybdopterin converting factor small subunit
MRVGVRYMAQLKLAAGVSAEQVELPPAATVADLVSLLAGRGDGALRKLLLDAEGRPHPTVLTFVGDAQADPQQTALRDGDVVTLLSPIAGG